MSTGAMPVNAADLTVAAYRRRKPTYPVIPETLGLALVLLIDRNNAPDRGSWLADPEVSDALCCPAEAFAQALGQRESPDGWRGGALASLRSLAHGVLHQAAQPWPYNREPGTEPVLVDRFWLDDDERWHWGQEGTRSPARAELVLQLAHRARISEAWDALLDTFRPGKTRAGHSIRGVLASWSSLHERPGDTRSLRGEIVEGRDLAAEREAWWAELLAGHQARHPGAAAAPDGRLS